MRRPAQGYWLLLLIASAILLITMGARQTIGLFIAPLDAATGLGIVAISLAVAIGAVRLGAGAAGVRRVRRPLRARAGDRVRRGDARRRHRGDAVRAVGMGADR